MGTKKVKAPAPRDYKQEMLDTMAGQEAIQPRLLALEQQYQPLYQKLQQDLMDRQSKYLMESYGKLIPESASLSKQYAEAMSPVYGTIGAGARSAYEQGLGEQTMGLYNIMQREAQKNLEAGYGLTPEGERLAQQSARAAMTARGLTGGNQGIAQEILNSYNLQQNRYKSALEQAQSAYTMGANQYGAALTAYGAPMIQQASYLSPVNTYKTAYDATQGLGAKIFQPESQYNAQLITANRKEAMDAQIANAQSRNALTSGLIGAVGTIGGAFLGNPALGSMLGAGAGATAGAVSGSALANVGSTSLLSASPSFMSGLGIGSGSGSALLGGGISGIGGYMPQASQTISFK